MENHALQQSRDFTRVLQSLGANAFSNPADVTQMIERGPVVMASRCDPRHLTPDMRNSHRGRIFVANPDRHDLAQMRRAGFRQILTPATVAEIDLRKPLAPHGKWRNAWRRANRGPIDTTHRPFRHSDDWFSRSIRVSNAKRGIAACPTQFAVLGLPTKPILPRPSKTVAPSRQCCSCYIIMWRPIKFAGPARWGAARARIIGFWRKRLII